MKAIRSFKPLLLLVVNPKTALAANDSSYKPTQGRLIMFLCFLILLSASVFGQDKTALLDSLFTSLYQSKSFNGNVLIAEKGKIIYEKSYGLANETTKEALNPQSVFELASVSKQFTAMGIVLLEKQGKLKYDDPIATYIPELGFYGNITIRNLLNHTGGLPDYMELFEEKWDKSKFATNEDIIKEFAKYKPKALFPPNEKFEYSNTGYALLGSIIEKVSKKSFGVFLQDNIFKPLHMNHTLVYRSRYQPQTIKNYALGYTTDSLDNKVLLNSFGKQYYTYYLDGIVGDGMVNTNLEDLLTWDRALYGDKLVNSKDKELIFKGTITNDKKKTEYGFGWMVADSSKYGKIANHSGSWAGYITFIEREMDNDKTIILLQNNATRKTKIPIRQIRQVLYGEPVDHENLKKAVITTGDLDKYLGVYAAKDIPIKLTITQKDNVLWAEATGQSSFPLDAYENHTFKYEESEIRMVFNPLENTLSFTQPGFNAVFVRE